MKFNIEEAVEYINEFCPRIRVIPSTHSWHSYTAKDKTDGSEHYWNDDAFISWAEDLKFERQNRMHAELVFDRAVCYCTVSKDLREVIKFPKSWAREKVKITVELVRDHDED